MSAVMLVAAHVPVYQPALADSLACKQFALAGGIQVFLR